MSLGNSWAPESSSPRGLTPMHPVMQQLFRENGLRYLAGAKVIPIQLTKIEPSKCFEQVDGYKSLLGLEQPPADLQRMSEPLGMFEIINTLEDLKNWVNEQKFKHSETIMEKDRTLRAIGLQIATYGISTYDERTMKLYVEVVDDFLMHWAGMVTDKTPRFRDMMRPYKLAWIAFSLKAQDLQLRYKGQRLDRR